MSDDQFMSGAATSKAEVKLSEEQIDLLHNDPAVVAARRAYLRDKKLGIQEAEEQAHFHYLRVFEARLQWVIENPPPPKPKAKPIVGFAKRA